MEVADSLSYKALKVIIFVGDFSACVFKLPQLLLLSSTFEA